MQVINRKERTTAKWRFAGLYLLSVALPVLLLLNAIDMNKVESNDTAKYVDQLRQRDQALAELSKLAATLNEAHRLKPAFDRVPPENQVRYDQLHYDFEKGVDKLKRLYFSDTVLYKYNYNLITFLDYNHKEFDHLGEEFKNKVAEEVAKNTSTKAKEPSEGGGSAAEIMLLKKELKDAEKTIAKMERDADLAARNNTGRPARNNEETERLRSKAEAMEENLKGFNVLLAGIEEEANKIQKKGDKNIDAKNKILEKVKNLKSLTSNIKNSNDILLSMVK
jgi:hypothetical protein